MTAILSVRFDPQDLPLHPQRRRPVRPVRGRALGIDLNPNWIGVAVASHSCDAPKIEDTGLLEQALVELDFAASAGRANVAAARSFC